LFTKHNFVKSSCPLTTLTIEGEVVTIHDDFYVSYRIPT